MNCLALCPPALTLVLAAMMKIYSIFLSLFLLSAINGDDDFEQFKKKVFEEIQRLTDENSDLKEKLYFYQELSQQNTVTLQDLSERFEKKSLEIDSIKLV